MLRQQRRQTHNVLGPGDKGRYTPPKKKRVELVRPAREIVLGDGDEVLRVWHHAPHLLIWKTHDDRELTYKLINDVMINDDFEF